MAIEMSELMGHPIVHQRFHIYFGAFLVAVASLFLTLMIFKKLYVFPAVNLVFMYFMYLRNRATLSNIKTQGEIN